MSLIVLASGKLLKPPTTRTAKNDEPYTVASMRAASDDGDVLLSLIAFGQAGTVLAALSADDALSDGCRQAEPLAGQGRRGAPRAERHSRRSADALSGEPAQAPDQRWVETPRAAAGLIHES